MFTYFSSPPLSCAITVVPQPLRLFVVPVQSPEGLTLTLLALQDDSGGGQP